MGLTIELPDGAADELIREAEREQVSPPEYAQRILLMVSALRKGRPEAAFDRAVTEFLRSRSLDPDRIATALDELILSLTRDRPEPLSMADVARSLIVSSLQREEPRKPPSSRGKFALIGLSSSDFAREKLGEIDREDRRSSV